MGVLMKNGINYSGGAVIVDNLNGTSASEALSAKQGNVIAADLAPMETTDTSTHAYAVGEHFLWKGQIVKVTTAIAVNDTISTSTNVAIDTLSGAIDRASSYKADKVSGAINGNLAGLDATGNLTDSGWTSDKTTASVSGNPISISNLKSNQLAINPIITLEPIQAGSGDPSPSNVRAISGYDKIEVLSCGKNLFNKNTVLSGKAINSYGILEDLSYYSLSDFIPVKPNTTYYLTNGVGISYFYSAGIFTKNKEFISDLNMYGEVPASGTIPIPSNAYYIRLNVPNAYIDSCQFEEGSTATTYEPYHETTDLSLQIGQTIYGGTLDVKTGVLTVDRGIVDLGDYNYNKVHDGSYFRTEIDAPKYKVPQNFGMCTCYQYRKYNEGELVNNNEITITSSYYASENYILIRDDSYTDTTAFKTAVTGQKLVYLITPFTIQLTPHEISLLSGYSYVSTNGTSMSFDYHNGELASLGDVSQLGETVNELGGAFEIVNRLKKNLIYNSVTERTELPTDIVTDLSVKYIVLSANQTVGSVTIPAWTHILIVGKMLVGYHWSQKVYFAFFDNGAWSFAREI